MSGRRGRASPAGHSGSGAPRQPGVRDAWGLEAPVPVSGGKHTSPELVLTKERTFPLTCGYGGAGGTGAQGPPGYGTQEDAEQERGRRGEGVTHRSLNCYLLSRRGVWVRGLPLL